MRIVAIAEVYFNIWLTGAKKTCKMHFNVLFLPNGFCNFFNTLYIFIHSKLWEGRYVKKLYQSHGDC